ncbi:hypothetical protein Pmar_PMAR026024 [Perkinsus marinus ATCC 50983]|uniref:Uncharacterized protein n=1 Tax=Perkinsus marinus (strain ATCC 50983 / TXsc) TaxID=423536 RepID=C5LK78_PERM5|nr:hypothetical protein Pmar_PMAR026024 [Perkinsus marinus ATCC 50983]EER02865.1 hypothetical protein Pmar_PMAR026024 [Perkinsus marinus ATCC 50983]|eukprot:XP_002771049.1 hypothetical protein Pmar_PMAR026024 [Perkinsus marinus ATCC 50983]
MSRLLLTITLVLHTVVLTSATCDTLDDCTVYLMDSSPNRCAVESIRFWSDGTKPDAEDVYRLGTATLTGNFGSETVPYKFAKGDSGILGVSLTYLDSSKNAFKRIRKMPGCFPLMTNGVLVKEGLPFVDYHPYVMDKKGRASLKVLVTNSDRTAYETSLVYNSTKYDSTKYGSTKYGSTKYDSTRKLMKFEDRIPDVPAKARCAGFNGKGMVDCIFGGENFNLWQIEMNFDGEATLYTRFGPMYLTYSLFGPRPQGGTFITFKGWNQEETEHIREKIGGHIFFVAKHYVIKDDFDDKPILFIYADVPHVTKNFVMYKYIPRR